MKSSDSYFCKNYFCNVERIYKYSERLLAYHDYVVVPGLGGFVVQKQSARILPDRIIPPMSTIGFNPLIKHGDGLLAIEIARAEGITYRKAVELIDMEVDRIKIQLSNGEKFIFGNFGELVTGENGNILFSPQQKNAFLPGNFQMNEIFATERNFSEKQQNSKQLITIPIANTFRYAAAASLIFGLLLISPQVNDVKRTDAAGFIPFSNTIIAPAQVADSVALACPELTSTELPDGQIQNNDSALYHVIVASMATLEDAQNYCATLKAEDYDCAHILNPVKTYRVAIQSFPDKNEAVAYMENLRKLDSRFETAWVLCK